MTNEQVTLIFSGIVALSTIAYVILTDKLVRETRLSREFFLESHIIAYLVNSETTPDIVSLVIKNIGKGVAKNVKCKITKDIDYKNANPLSTVGIFNEGIKYFPPEHELKYILMSLADNPDKAKDSITFKIEYSDALKKKREQWFTLGFKEINGLGKLTPPETYIGMISYRLEKIQKLLEKSTKQIIEKNG